MIRRISLLRILIFFIPLTIISQGEKKLSKKEANEEVKQKHAVKYKLSKGLSVPRFRGAHF